MTRRLSPRQEQALDSYSRLGDMALAAAEMGISVSTLKGHLDTARLKLSVDTTVQAVRIFLERSRPAA